MKTHVNFILYLWPIFFQSVRFPHYLLIAFTNSTACSHEQSFNFFFLSSFVFLSSIYLLHVYYLVQSSHILLTYCQELCFSSSSSAFPLMTYCQEFCFTSSGFPLTSLPSQPSSPPPPPPYLPLLISMTWTENLSLGLI